MAQEIRKKGFALITGASQGIGKAFALSLAKMNYSLVLVALPNSGLSEVKSEIENRFSIRVHSIEIDLCKNEAPYEIKKFCEANNIALNILINNAGIGYVGPLKELSTEFLETLISLNVKSLSVLSHLFIDDLEHNSPSYILNMGSLASVSPLPYKSAYSASKAFVYYFSRGLREELKSKNISVCVVMPGSVPTNEQTLKRISASGWKARISSIDPDELAERSLKALFKKKSVYVPGKLNRALTIIQKIIPVSLRIKMAGKMFKNQQIT